jgi:hypothetical protein
MKRFCVESVTLLGLSLMSTCFGQTPDGTSFTWKHKGENTAASAQITADDVKFALVSNILAAGSPVSEGSVQLHGMGDEAAVILLKILGSKPGSVKWTDEETKTILEILKIAFEHPKSILSRSDVKPRATTLLLRMIKADDPGLESEISRIEQSANAAASQRLDH